MKRARLVLDAVCVLASISLVWSVREAYAWFATPKTGGPPR